LFGVAKEQARKDLPLSTYTELYWKIDLLNLLKFLAKRMDKAAQKEIRDYANVMGAIIEIGYPNIWQAHLDFDPHKNAMRLSAPEQVCMQMLYEFRLRRDGSNPTLPIGVIEAESKRVAEKIEEVLGKRGATAFAAKASKLGMWLS
jgi:thymidylate synthase ThyX